MDNQSLTSKINVSYTTDFATLSEGDLRTLEQEIKERKQQQECEKWDRELVGRFFRVVRAKNDPLGINAHYYATLEESMAVGTKDRYVYADEQYLHIRCREGSTLHCSGFQFSSKGRREPYLKIQPAFEFWSDFRDYLNSWPMDSGPKAAEEISREEYAEALNQAIAWFSGHAENKYEAGQWR